MTILAVDIGKATGVAVMVKGEIEHKQKIVFKSLAQYESELKEIINVWKPTHIVTCKPNRYYNTILLHGRLLGILELLSEKCKVPNYNEFHDSEVKKAIFDSPRAKKEDVMEFYDEPDNDIADAVMFCDFAATTLKMV